MRVLRPLSQGESALTLAWTGFYCFSQVLTSKKDLLSITQNIVVYILGTIKEMKITNAKGKGGELISSVLGKIHTGFGNYLEDSQ